MNKLQNTLLFLLRIALGWLFFYAGITKVLNPNWSSAFYLKTAQTLPQLFTWFSNPQVLPYIDFLNKWGLTLIGVSLILGIWVRWSSVAAVVLMGLYYLPILHFPYVGEHSYIVDEHIIYIIALLVLFATRAGTIWGIDARLRRHY